MLGERARAAQEVREVRHVGGGADRCERAPPCHVGQGEHRVARAAQQRHVELSCELLEVARRIGAVNGRHRAEERLVVPRKARKRSQRELTPFVVRLVAELREVGLREEHVEVARLRARSSSERGYTSVSSAMPQASSGFPGAR